MRAADANLGLFVPVLTTDSSIKLQSVIMVMHQYVAASLGLLSLAAIAGAGVGVGSGVGMMAMAMAEEQAKQEVRASAACLSASMLCSAPSAYCVILPFRLQ